MLEPHGYHPHDDDWTDSPSQTPTSKYLLGLIVPAPFALYGVRCIVLKEGAIPSDYQPPRLRGNDAIALGIAAIAIALFLHFHYFWGNTRFGNVMVVGKIASLIALIGGSGFLIARAFTH